MSHKVLILTGTYGDGHLQAARAITDALVDSGPNVEPVVADIMELTHPLMHPISRYLFIQGVKSFPTAYGYLYKKTRSANSLSLMLKKCSHLGAGKLMALLKEIQPSIVVSTFPPAAGAMSFLRTNGMTSIPSVTMMTDYTDHSYWVHEGTDHYLVGSDGAKWGLVEQGVTEDRISVTGIPVRKGFAKPEDRSALLLKHGLCADQPILLLMGGGEGLIPGGLELLRQLEELPTPVQLLIGCGRNEKLRQQLDRMAAASKHRVSIHGYVSHVNEWMALADLMVTKAGGLTVSESLAMELPLFLFKPLPGQEEDNTRFLVQSGAAVHAGDCTELMKMIRYAIEHPEMLAVMRRRAQSIQRKQAAAEAARIILELQHMPTPGRPAFSSMYSLSSSVPQPMTMN